MEAREIKLSIERATRWANGTDEELKSLTLQTYPELAKKQLPKSWEELEKVIGYYIYGGAPHKTTVCETVISNQNIFTTENQAKSASQWLN